MEIVDLAEKKAKKEGKVTPKALIQNLLAAVERGEVVEVAYVAIDKDDVTRAGWSKMSTIKAIGLLEVGKDILIRNMEE